MHFGAAVVNEPGAVCWSELGTHDLDGARRFYSAVFGYEWDDTDATVAKAQELGGGVNMAAMDSPYGRFAILRDPQGAVFSAIQLAAQS